MENCNAVIIMDQVEIILWIFLILLASVVGGEVHYCALRCSMVNLTSNLFASFAKMVLDVLGVKTFILVLVYVWRWKTPQFFFGTRERQSGEENQKPKK